MKLLLKDFQEEFVDQLFVQIRACAREASTTPQAVVFSAPTGSGKTVMAAAVIEKLLEGDSEYGPDKEAVILWLSDQPEINEQTRRKMLEASTVLGQSRLVVVDATFDYETFAPGKVYFLNTQKLGREKQLVTHSDERTTTIWETITNTVRAHPEHFFMFIDEAHRGMTASQKEQSEANSIAQKFIIGSDEISPVPIIIGISATPERFRRMVESTRRVLRSVDVPAEAVRASGLLVDAIRLFYPTESQPTDITMLKAAASSWNEFTKRWESYGRSQSEPSVRPILVVQVEDGTGGRVSNTDLEEAIDVVNESVGHLPADSFAHSFQEGGELDVGAQKLRYLAPADINSDPTVRVVFFKMSLNTGWDCPRAEVMMSFRKAIDATLIAQLVGRMVRTPLARRIESDDFLNMVTLYLPHYDETGLQRVVEKLTKPDPDYIPPVAIEKGVDMVTLSQRKGAERDFEALSKIPSYVIPRPRKIKGVRRLMKLARLLANDEIDPNAVEVANESLVSVLRAEYQRLSKTREFKSIVQSRGKVKVKSVDWQITGELGGEDTIVLDIAKQNLDDLFDTAGRKMGEGLHKAWWKYRAGSSEKLLTRAKLETVAFCLVPQVLSKLEKEAQALARKWLKEHDSLINDLPESRREHYIEVRQLASEPEEVSIAYLPTIEAKKGAKTFRNHLYVDETGLFSTDADRWESKVIEEDLESASGWLRNFDRKSWSLIVPYQVGGSYRPLYPDFLATRVSHDRVVVDIMDPHHTGLADAAAKAVGLAQYAAKHADRFGRIELIIIVGDKIRRLDLKDELVRQKVKLITTSEQLEKLYEEEG